MKQLDDFYTLLWQQYIAICPQALSIHHLFEREGEVLVNDHVAFRTFANSPISIDNLEPEIFALGYQYFDSYQFKEKKLTARCYVHTDTPTKIFISQLHWHELNAGAQHIINKLIKSITVETQPTLCSGRLWLLPSYQDYLTLLAQSEYAAWLTIWGLRANHFTLFINRLKIYTDLSEVVDLLLRHDYKLNSTGGIIKGNKEQLLIQASTLADKQKVKFDDGLEQLITTCYYEFAERFEQTDGELFQGFVTTNADKIFESTDMSKV